MKPRRRRPAGAPGRAAVAGAASVSLPRDAWASGPAGGPWAGSSVGQSTRLISVGSEVRALPGPCPGPLPARSPARFPLAGGVAQWESACLARRGSSVRVRSPPPGAGRRGRGVGLARGARARARGGGLCQGESGFGASLGLAVACLTGGRARPLGRGPVPCGRPGPGASCVLGAGRRPGAVRGRRAGGGCRARGLAREKGIWWMPWHQEARKDVARCEKPRGAASRR
jgi:hypothetical protein